MGVRKRSAAEMEERAKKEKEDEEALKRWRRAVEYQKMVKELEAEGFVEEDGIFLTSDEEGYEPTTDVSRGADEDGYEPTTDVSRGVLRPVEWPMPDTQTAIDADALRADQKPAGSSKNSKYAADAD